MKGAALFIAVVAAAAVVILPAWILNPFAPETPQGLAVAYAAKRWAPLVTALLAAAGIFLAFRLWHTWWRKTLVVVAMLVLAATTWLAHQNHFEWMFAPLQNAAYADSANAPFVEQDDMVLAVAHNGEAAAYPVRQLAYHHLVHDVVGGVPIVVTY
jgi:small-conductance mechanosensitive channel